MKKAVNQFWFYINMIRLTVFPFFLLAMVMKPVMAQDDLLKMVLSEGDSEILYVESSFKTTKIINAHTNETVKGHNLDFRVGHRFGSVGKGSGGDIHSLYGLDVSSDIRIAFEYGINDRFTTGFSRSKFRENLEGLLKYRLLMQRVDEKMPVSVTLFTNTAYTPALNNNKLYDKVEHRFSYTFQTIVARKFSHAFSLQLIPTLVHRNYVPDFDDANDLFSIGVGGRLKLTKHTSLIGDYFYNVSDYRSSSDDYFNPLGLGVEIQTGGHVFSLMFSNASALIENEYIPYTTDSWSEGGYKFSFNISRVFALK
jgi:hypothetical protein